MQILPASFYEQYDAISLAQQLLGKILSVDHQGETLTAMIVETEAYRESDDKGCHTYRHGRTTRTESMYTAAGHAYVYMCYGIHPMLNVVAGPINQGDAVLIRAVEPITGQNTMQALRGHHIKAHDLTNGPGKLTVALGISQVDDGIALFATKSKLKILNSDISIKKSDIVASPRVGMSKFVAECSHWPWRFYITDNRYVSRPLQVSYEGKW
jgi:DNA-3-methyladenine glycosylase